MRGQALKAALGITLGAVLALSACQPKPGGAAETAEQMAEKDIFSASSIKAVTDGVADWQMAHMEEEQWAPFVPSFQHRTIEKRGWIQGTYFKGLVDWAAQTNNDRYFKFLKDFAEGQDYQPEARIYHADDHVVPVSLDAGELYPVKESSGTAFFVAGLAWGVANGTLDAETYMPAIRKGWEALNDSVTDDGMMGWVQQVGYAPDKVSANETQFYGAGAFLLAGAAMLELSEKGLLK